MRGEFSDPGRMFSYVSPEARVPRGHPLRAIRAMVRAVLEELHGDFAKLYSSEGRPWVVRAFQQKRRVASQHQSMKLMWFESD